MLYATDLHGADCEASPGAKAFCPQCGSAVRAKCGPLVEWHWAHVGLTGDCDLWAESETPWHRWWKNRVAREHREVVIPPHRADILLPDKGVVELQHSPISALDVGERERFYGKMIWLLDARTYSAFDPYQFDDVVPRLAPKAPGTWKWNWPRTSFASTTKIVCFDLGREVLVGEKGGIRQHGGDDVRDEVREVIVTGRTIPRDRFLEKLSLIAPSEEELRAAVSYIARWRSETARKATADGEPRACSFRMREFRDRGALERFIQREPRDELRVWAWLGTGKLEEFMDLAAPAF